MTDEMRDSVGRWMEKFRNLVLGLTLAGVTFLAGAVWNNSIRISALEPRMTRAEQDIQSIAEGRYNSTDAQRDQQVIQRQFDQFTTQFTMRLDRIERKIDEALAR